MPDLTYHQAALTLGIDRRLVKCWVNRGKLDKGNPIDQRTPTITEESVQRRLQAEPPPEPPPPPPPAPAPPLPARRLPPRRLPRR